MKRKKSLKGLRKALKRDKLIKTNPNILKKIEKSCSIFWNRLWLPLAVFIIIFLGYLQHKYQYETTFIQDFSYASGLALKAIYSIGTTWPWYLWILLFVGTIYFGITPIIDIWRKNGKRNEKKQKKKKVKREEESSV